MLDKIDKQILKILQENSRTTNISISQAVGLAPSGTLKRIKKLEEEGVITRYALGLKKDFFDLNVMAFVFIKTETSYPDSVVEELLKVPNVLEAHAVVGEYSFIVKIVAKSPDHLLNIIQGFSTIPQLLFTNTNIVLNTYDENNNIPLN